jgi:heme oxygenase
MKNYLYILGLAVILISAGCGRNDVPDPPTAYNQLVIGLFKDLDAKDYRAAANKASKLKALDPENAFLNQLIENELSNYYIKQAQKKLNAGKLAAAQDIISAGRSKYPFNQNLIKTEAYLKQVSELAVKVKSISVPFSSEELQRNIKAIEKLQKSIPEAKSLNKILKQKSEQAKAMAKREERRARFSLLCDLKDQEKQNNEVAKTLAIQFELENAKAAAGNKLPSNILNK